MSTQALMEMLRANVNQKSPSEGVVNDVIGDKVFIATSEVGLVDRLKRPDDIIKIGMQVRIDSEYCYPLNQHELEIHIV